ncbi:hypothetical protein NFI96_009227 [Prochilodus magdalenae]|nr:hypothetical protein NFI96_009227 [Prochilodus magdalenae]
MDDRIGFYFNLRSWSSDEGFLTNREYITACKQTHKSELEKKFSYISEGMSQQGVSTLLNDIYTNLYITEWGSGDISNEHEVRQIERTSSRQTVLEKPIQCNNIFKLTSGEDRPIRTVLTKEWLE